MMYRCIQERRAFTASEDISSNHQAGVFRCDSHWLLQDHGSAEPRTRSWPNPPRVPLFTRCLRP
jgi:hypothetical protein